MSGEHSQAPAGALSAEQRARYEEEGYLVLPRLLGPDELAGVIAAIEHRVDLIADSLVAAGLVQDRREGRPFDTRLAELFEGLSDADFIRHGCGWRDRFPGYYGLLTHPKILDAVESLVGGEIFANPVYNARPKIPGAPVGAVPWHQDRSYWPGAQAEPVITVWIPLVDVDVANGCLYVIPRTHRGDLWRHHTERVTGVGYTELDLETVRTERAVPLPVPQGSAVLFNDRFVHMSGPNRSTSVRWSVDLRYQPMGQDPMRQHGTGFLARSRSQPGRVASLDDWLAGRMEAAAPPHPPDASPDRPGQPLAA